MFLGAGRRWAGELVFNRYGVSVWAAGKFQRLDGADGGMIIEYA